MKLSFLIIELLLLTIYHRKGQKGAHKIISKSEGYSILCCNRFCAFVRWAPLGD